LFISQRLEQIADVLLNTDSLGVSASNARTQGSESALHWKSVRRLVRLAGKVNTWRPDLKERYFLWSDLKSAAKVSSLKTLRRFGPFSMKAYWYNRQLIRASAGIPNFQYVKNTVNAWAGGLMLYRGGFRVREIRSAEDIDGDVLLK
jgi:hypothetical protein